jgi:hypothetical protein
MAGRRRARRVGCGLRLERRGIGDYDVADHPTDHWYNVGKDHRRERPRG